MAVAEPELVIPISPELTETVVSLPGEFDLNNAPDAEQLLVEAAADSNPDAVIVDLSGNTYLDSTMMGVFVRRQRALRKEGRNLVFRNPGRSAQQIFRITGFDKKFSIEFVEDTKP